MNRPGTSFNPRSHPNDKVLEALGVLECMEQLHGSLHSSVVLFMAAEGWKEFCNDGPPCCRCGKVTLQDLGYIAEACVCTSPIRSQVAVVRAGVCCIFCLGRASAGENAIVDTSGC